MADEITKSCCRDVTAFPDYQNITAKREERYGTVVCFGEKG